MSNSRSVKNIMSIKALTNNDTDSIQYDRNNNTNNYYNNNSNNDNANNKNYNFVFETFGQTDCNTVSKRKFNNRHLKEKEESVTGKKNYISKSDNNSIQESQIRILSAKELPNIATKPNAIILSHQVLEEMLEKNEHASSMFESVSNSWKKTDESVLAYNRNNSNNSLYRPNIISEASSSLPPSLTNTSSSPSSSSSSSSSHLYSLNNSNSNSNSNNNNNDSDDFADNQSKKNKNKNSSSPQNEDDGKEKKPEGEKKKKKKNYNYKKKAYRLQNINKLKKPRNGYMIYMNEVYETVKSQHPELKFGELSTFIGRQWKSLSKEKQQPYHDRHEKEKIAYDNAKVAMGTSKLHIVEESIDDIMAKKSAISAFSNASFAAFTSSSPTPPPLQSLQMPPPPLKSQLLSSPKNPIITTTAINTSNVNNINYNNNKIYNYNNNNNNFLPTPPQTSPTTANITATTNTTSSTSYNLPPLFMTTTLDKFSAPKIIKNESSDSEDSQFNATNNTITNNNPPPKRARIIFNENNDQSSLSMRTSTALTATTSTSSMEIAHSTTKNKWHLPIEGTFTSPGLSPFRKRKVKNTHQQDGDDDDDADYNSIGGDQSPTSNNSEAPSSKVKKL